MSLNTINYVHRVLEGVKLLAIGFGITFACTADVIGAEATQCAVTDTTAFDSRLAFQTSYSMQQSEESADDYTLTLKYKLSDDEPVKETVSMLETVSMKLGTSLLFNCSSDGFQVSSLSNEDGQLFLVVTRRFTTYDSPVPQEPDLLLALLERLDSNLNYANAFNHFSQSLNMD
jgi:hypothetical protein